MKEVPTKKGSFKKGARKLSKEDRQNRKNSLDVSMMDESEKVNKLADMRVSNAVTISNRLPSRKKDQFIKKILKDGDMKNETGLGARIDEVSEGSFDIEN
jgi:hypothetical protein